MRSGGQKLGILYSLGADNYGAYARTKIGIDNFDTANTATDLYRHVAHCGNHCANQCRIFRLARKSTIKVNNM